MRLRLNILLNVLRNFSKEGQNSTWKHNLEIQLLTWKHNLELQLLTWKYHYFKMTVKKYRFEINYEVSKSKVMFPN